MYVCTCTASRERQRRPHARSAQKAPCTRMRLQQPKTHDWLMNTRGVGVPKKTVWHSAKSELNAFCTCARWSVRFSRRRKKKTPNADGNVWAADIRSIYIFTRSVCVYPENVRRMLVVSGRARVHRYARALQNSYFGAGFVSLKLLPPLRRLSSKSPFDRSAGRLL